MATRCIALAIPFSALLLFNLPASAEPGSAEALPPTASAGVTSWLSPFHVGAGLVMDAEGRSRGGPPPGQICSDALQAAIDDLELEDGVEPGDDLLSALLLTLPELCRTRSAIRITPPLILDDTCDPGHVWGIRGTVRWTPGNPFDPPGKFTWEGNSIMPAVNEVAFNTCLEIFDPDTDIAGVEEAVPTPAFQKSPEVTGLTGLETWLWLDLTDPTTHTVTAADTTSRIENLPLLITATAWIDRFMWDLDGDGTWDQEVDVPDIAWHRPPPHQTFVDTGGDNSDEGAAAHYTYLRKGLYDVTIGVTWRGVYTVTSSDPSVQVGGTYPYTPVTRTETYPYRVCELVGVLTSSHQRPNGDNSCPTP